MFIERVKKLLEQTTIYITSDCEAIRVLHCEDLCFTGIGEESGELYTIDYAVVDIEKDQFMGLVRLDPKALN